MAWQMKRKPGYVVRKYNNTRIAIGYAKNIISTQKLVKKIGKAAKLRIILKKKETSNSIKEAQEQANRLWERMVKYPETYEYHYDN